MSTKSGSTTIVRPPSGTEGDPASRAVERWFQVLLSSLLPLLAGLFAPDSWRGPLHVSGGALCVCGLILLVRHELAERRKSHVTDR